MKSRSCSLPLLLILLMLPACSFATTLYFDEFGTSPLLSVDGMHVFGVTFHFSPGEADYNGQIGTSGLAVSGFRPAPHRANHRDAHTCLRYPDATAAIRLGVAQSGHASAQPTRSLFPAGTVLSGSTTPQPVGLYSEGTFQYTGAPITGAAITFFNGTDSLGGDVAAFGLDNLTYVPNSGAHHTHAARWRPSGSRRDREDARSKADSSANANTTFGRSAKKSDFRIPTVCNFDPARLPVINPADACLVQLESQRPQSSSTISKICPIEPSASILLKPT